MLNTSVTVLVVDDEAANRKLLEMLLQSEGYSTMTAVNGEEALASVRQHTPDLIMLDIMMPGMDGYEVARVLKADPATSHIPIIMVTAQIDRSARITGLNAGAEEFLTKPVDRAELSLRVRNLLRLKAYSDLLRDQGADLERQLGKRSGELLRFRSAMDRSVDAIMIVNRTSMRFVDVNATACTMFGYAHEELTRLGPSLIAKISQPELAKVYDDIIADPTGHEWIELLFLRKNGTQFQGEVHRHALRDGTEWYIVGVVRDITERKVAEARIKYLNRLYAVLSSINVLIVRVHTREELFTEACRIVVDTGGFKMAWIGLIGPDETIVRVASTGMEAELLSTVQAAFSSSKSVANPPLVEVVIKEKRAVFSNDSQNDDRILLHQEHVKHGIHSVAILPLIVSDKAVGVFVLSASEVGFFQDEESKLLMELTGDISFAIDNIDKQERLNYLAYYDALTGLANRSLFLDRLTQYMHSAVSGGHKLALFLIDIERFKNINDSLGQLAGDALLRQVAEWMTRYAGDINLVTRAGADHFAILLPKIRPEGDMVRFLEKTIAAFMDHPFHLNDAVFRLSAKVGVALFPDDGTDPDTLFRNAEAALKKAKASGERYLFYTHTMTSAMAGKLTLENQLRQALDNEEFVLHYQPKVNLVSGKVTGAEALIRWNDPRTGLVPPGRFIPVLEETGMINEVGRWALRKAIEDYLRWHAAGLHAVRIAVNVSPLQLRNRDFISDIKRKIDIDAHAATSLELEITESLIMEDVKHSISSLQAIRAMGVFIAIDDFGTGFSSLSYLSKLPVDTLKIDRSFILDMTVGPEGLALVSTIINLAHSLKLNVVAEGVETEEQSRLLRLLDCDEMQGFLFSKALPAEIFETRYLAHVN